MQRSKFGSEIIGFDLANVLCALSANKLFIFFVWIWNKRCFSHFICCWFHFHIEKNNLPLIQGVSMARGLFNHLKISWLYLRHQVIILSKVVKLNVMANHLLSWRPRRFSLQAPVWYLGNKKIIFYRGLAINSTVSSEKCMHWWWWISK